MTDYILGKVAGIICYPAKDKAEIIPQEVMLRQNLGMEGDFHADGGERQISLLSRDAREWMRAQSDKGICFTRYKENLSLDGIPMEQLCIGSRIKMGEATLEISAASRHCHSECPLFSRGATCRLAKDGLYAKVVKSGKVSIGDLIEQEAHE